MNKFQSLISTNNAVLANRAKIVSDNAKIEQEELIRNLQREINKTKLEIDQITDLSPTTTVSLTPNIEAWNPKDWVEKLQTLKEHLYEFNIALTLAQETYTEFFSEQ